MRLKSSPKSSLQRSLQHSLQQSPQHSPGGSPSHSPEGSAGSPSHSPAGSPSHSPEGSPSHSPEGSPSHLVGLTIAESPQQDRPRERLQHLGAEHLRLAELLAVLVRAGRPGESALQAGEKVASKFSNRLEQLPAASAKELKVISPAIASTAYCQIMAGIELGRRVAAAKNAQQSQQKISGTRDAKLFCERHFARLASDGSREEFHIVCLDTKNKLIATHQISVGTLDASLVHPREVFRPAIKDSAAAILLVHNHPSGDPTPSNEDLAVTDRLQESGVTLGIEVLDHIVLGNRGGVSIREFR